jgi:CHASE2 domain-containing sensor protein
LKYENFDIWIERERNGRYPVVLYPPSLTDDEYLSEEISSQDLARAWEEFDKNKSSREVLENVGRTLFKCLFYGDILIKYNEEFGKIRDDDSKGLRIRLFIKDPNMAKVPWELLYDPSKNRFLATWIKTPIVRYLRVSDANRGLSINPPLRVLVAIPSFSGLNVVEEERIIRGAFVEMEKKGLVQVEFMTDRVSIVTITNMLKEKGPFHIFHFIGHGCFKKGEDDGYLLVNRDPIGDETDSDALIDVEELEQLSAEDFADLFQNHSSLKLVVLNSCLGAKASQTRPLAGLVPRLFSREIPAVVAMQYPIMNDAALRFAAQFYGTLCKGYQRGLIDVAVTGARNLMHIKGRNELSFATPVLFMRSDSSAIFDLRFDEAELELEDPFGDSEQVTLSVGPARTFSSPFRFLWHKVRDPVRLASDAPRLTALKEAREKNIEVVEQKKQQAATVDEVGILDSELAYEKSEVERLDKRLSAVPLATQKISRAALVSGFAIVLFVTLFLINFVGVDELFQRAASNYLRGELLGGRSFADDQIRLIVVDKKKEVDGFPHSHRSDDRANHAEMIDALTKAGASVVAIDIFPNGPSQWDATLANSIKRAELAGTHVIMGTNGVTTSGQPESEIPESLLEAMPNKIGNLQSGLILAGLRPALRGVALGNEITTGPDAQLSQGDVPLFPSFALQTIRYFHLPANARPADVFFDRENRIIRLPGIGEHLPRPIRVNNDDLLYYFTPADESILQGVRRSYQEIYANRNNLDRLQEFRGKIVMIGYDIGADLFYVNGSRQMPGVEIQACVVSNILQGIETRRLSMLLNILIFLLMIGIGLLLQTNRLQQFSIHFPFESPVYRKLITLPILLIVVLLLYLTVIYFIYRRTDLELDVPYQIAALFISYWFGNVLHEKGHWIRGLIQKLRPDAREEVVERA